ncbi:MAG: hypothetical protein KAF27_00065 [Porphyrobacter sp.]|nr:hypothetical protein [Porphyrobacter sp.]
MAENWLGNLIKPLPPAKPYTVTLAPLSGYPVPPSRISGALKLRTVEVQFVAPVRRKVAPKPGLKLTFSVAHGPGPCGLHPHPIFMIDPPPPGHTQPLPAKTFASRSVEFHAEPIDNDPTGLTTPFRFIAAMFSKADLAKSYLVSAESCGVRTGPAVTVQRLAFRVKILPEKVVTVKLSLPELLSKSKTREGSAKHTITSTGGSILTTSSGSSTSSTNRLARMQDGVAVTSQSSSTTSSNSSVTDPSGYRLDVKVNQTTNKVMGSTDVPGLESFNAKHSRGTVSMAPAGGKAEVKDTSKSSKGDLPTYAGGIGLSVTDDLVEIGGSFKDFVDAIDTAKSIIQGINDLQKWMNDSVQIGWKVSGTVKTLSGDIKVVWGIKQIPDEPVAARYFGADVSLLLIEAGAQISFGIQAAFSDLASDATYLDARAIGSLTGTVKLAGSYEELTGRPAPTKKVTLQGQVILKLQGKLALMKVLQIDAQVSGGVDATGTFTGGVTQGPSCTVKAGLTPVTASATVKSFLWSDTYGPTTLIGKSPPFFTREF